MCVIRYLGSFQVDMGSIGVSDLLWAIRGFWVRGNFGFELSRSRYAPSALPAWGGWHLAFLRGWGAIKR